MMFVIEIIWFTELFEKRNLTWFISISNKLMILSVLNTKQGLPYETEEFSKRNLLITILSPKFISNNPSMIEF